MKSEDSGGALRVLQARGDESHLRSLERQVAQAEFGNRPFAPARQPEGRQGLQPGLAHGRFIATLAFGNRCALIAGSQKNNPSVAEIDQMLRGQYSSSVVVAADERGSQARQISVDLDHYMAARY